MTSDWNFTRMDAKSVGAMRVETGIPRTPRPDWARQRSQIFFEEIFATRACEASITGRIHGQVAFSGEIVAMQGGKTCTRWCVYGSCQCDLQHARLRVSGDGFLLASEGMR